MSIFRLSLALVVTMAPLAGCDAASEVQADLVDGQMNSFAKEQIEVYNIAKKNDDKMQTCTQAMAIAQIFLQSKDEQNWKIWKEKEKTDCEAAGIPVS